MAEKKQQVEVPAGPREKLQEVEIVQVDKAYLIKRLNDLVNSNPDIFNEYFFLKKVLAPKPPQEVKE